MGEPEPYDNNQGDPDFRPPDLRVYNGNDAQEENPDADRPNATITNISTARKKKAATAGSPLESAENKALGGGVGGAAAAGETAALGLGNIKTSGFLGGAEVAGTQKLRLLGDAIKRRKKPLLIGGGVGGGIGGGLIALFFALIPLKIEHIVNNLENRFTASGESAIADTTEGLFSGYIGYLLDHFPSSNCSSTLSDKNCKIFFSGTGPIRNLYRTWKQEDIEAKMAAPPYNLEFRYDSTSHTYYVKTPGMTDPEKEGKIPESELTSGSNMFEDGTFSKATRSEVRSAYRDAMQNTSLFNRVALHFSFGTLLEEKYGIRRCIIFCTVTDKFTDALNHGKSVVKLELVSRVIQPRSQTLGIVLTCLFDDTCKPNQIQAPDPNCESDCAPHGEGENPTVDTTVRDKLTALAAQYGYEDVDQLVNLYDSITEAGGASAYFLQQALILALGEDAGKAASEKISSAIPVIGWINLAAQVVNDANNLGPKIKKLSYITAAPAAVGLYMMYRSYADEVQTGHANAQEVGQFTDSLGPTAKVPANCQPAGSAACDPNVGGTASAEGTPLYSALIDNNTQPIAQSTTSLLNEAVSTKTYAASDTTSSGSTSPSNFLCNNGLPVPTGQLVCNEELLSIGNGITNDIHNFLSMPGFNVITQVAAVWRDTIGKAFSVVGNLISWLASPVISAAIGGANDVCTLPKLAQAAVPPPGIWPAYCGIKDVASAAAGKIMMLATNELIPNAYGTNMSGGRTFDEMAAGADVSGNYWAHQGLGGEAISNQQASVIYNDQQSDEQYSFDHESLYARIFDTSSPFSLVSKIAMAMPFNITDSVQSTFDTFLSNPLGGLAHGFASLLSIGKADAAATSLGSCPGDTSAYSNNDDFFCVTQYGYPPGAVPSNPEAYWDEHCADNPTNAGNDQETTAWNANSITASNTGVNTSQAYVDPNSGTPVSTTTDPCLLIQETVGAAGGLFNTNLLPANELADSPSSSTTTTAANDNLYIIGDSLSAGMDTANVQQNLSAEGWNVTKDEHTVGINITDSIPMLQADSAQVKQSGTVVVELGTNDITEGPNTFYSEMTQMLNAIRAINPQAQIYWQNLYATQEPGISTYQAINQEIDSQSVSTSGNYRVLDWASEVTNNPGEFNFSDGSDSGVHPDNYGPMAQWFASELGAAPVGQTSDAGSSTNNIVAQAVLGTGSSNAPSILVHNVSSFFATVAKDVVRPIKQLSLTLVRTPILISRLNQLW